MTKRAVVQTLAWATVLMFTRSASAQVLNFAASGNDLRTPQQVESFRADRPSPKFPAGSGVWAVMFVDPRQVNVGNFSSGHLQTPPDQVKPLKVTVSLLNEHGNFDDLYVAPLQIQDPSTDHILFPVLPDADDPKLPGFEQLMTRLEQHKKGVPLQVKVRVDSNDPKFWTQNGFILDETHGLGRYQAWLDARAAGRHKAELAQLPARTQAVRAYRSVRADRKVEADAKKWWAANFTGGQKLQGVKTCSDLILVKDRYGLPSEKQWCVLYTYKGNGKCWAMMRRLSYRRVGANTYDTQFVDSTYASMHLPVGKEQFDGAREYELSCK